MELTPKQEMFCEVYVKTGNASEAYRTAYDVSTTNDNTINPMASKLLKKDVISAKVKELREGIQDLHKITRDKVLNRLYDIIFKQTEIGVDKIDLSAMNKAIDTVNKMMGYYEPKKIEHSGSLNLSDFYQMNNK